MKFREDINNILKNAFIHNNSTLTMTLARQTKEVMENIVN